MNFQDLQRWHWVVIGLLVGAAVGWGRVMAMTDRAVGGPGFITQAAFEAKLRYPPVMGKPHIAGIVIHPRGEVDLVSLRELDTETLQYRERWFAAPRHYVPLGRPPVEGFSVRDFLMGESMTNAAIRFPSAWWESPIGAVAVGAAGAAFVIGGIWPFILNFIVRAGFGRKAKQPEYDLSRFKSEPAREGEKEMTEEERRHLEELEAEMMAGLEQEKRSFSSRGERVSVGVRQLAEEAVEAAPDAAEEDKAYMGEYYPVEKKVPHGFTLVELLIVMGIIAVIVAILLPMVSRARAESQMVKCASNLRQVGAGLELYNQANRHLPYLPTPAALVSAMSSVNVEAVMVCPSDVSGAPAYAMNSAYAGMPKSAGEAGDVLASETTSRHDGKSNVVFFDGHVDEQ
jgi:prepilin-type N-terminal cleavage/methylation domain-containing protein/prepilin-type processing-associated H-X9-DG protein